MLLRIMEWKQWQHGIALNALLIWDELGLMAIFYEAKKRQINQGTSIDMEDVTQKLFFYVKSI